MTAIATVVRSYYKKFKFVVEIAGVQFAGFKTCSEIRGQTAVIEHHEGGSLVPNKSLGRLTFPNVTLTRGATDDLDLYAWWQQTVAASALVADPDFKRTIDIVQQDRRGLELRRWTLHLAFPTEFKAGDWDNDADENTVEELILAYDFFSLGGDIGV